MISNPFCKPCEEAHRFLEEWIQQRQDLQVKFLFVHNNRDDDAHTKIARHLIALSLLKDKNIVARALNDWYKQKDYEIWAAIYPVIITEEIKARCTQQKKWCDNIYITFTPTILVDGYKLPEPYQLEDLKYLI